MKHLPAPGAAHAGRAAARPALPRLALPRLALPCRALPRLALPRLALACLVLACLAVAGCGSPPPPAFNPGGPASTAPATPMAQSSGPGSVIMPPFGKNAHVIITPWRPKNASLASAVLTDKDYELAYLYAEYTGGQADSWTSYVSVAMAPALRNALSAKKVTTESFQGTIRFFDMAVAHDPKIAADVDVSGCVDTAQATNTDLATGRVLPGQSPSDSSYYRYTDELAPIAGGQWQVVGNYQPIYYPQAKECKP